MEIQEQQFVRELAESRMQIELLRNRVLLRYYAQLLELDIMEQTQEVKALMSSINTLERYARNYEPQEPGDREKFPGTKRESRKVSMYCRGKLCLVLLLVRG